MTVKSDRWIRRMALERRMIEPFSEKQVREGVISYGLSSYGYDVRIADEFKIFTNINSTIVDPKRFDPRSFVDFKGEVCLIPPNSFALARTVEYFRIPRNVITVCVGKCVSGDSRVLDAGSGRLLPITDLLDREGAAASLRGHAIAGADVASGQRQGVLPVYELATRSGRKIRATPNHPFLAFGGWRALQDLPPGARIAVPRRIPIFGRRRMRECEVDLLGLLLSGGRCNTPGRSPGHATGDPVVRELFAAAVSAFAGVPRPAGRVSALATDSGQRGGGKERNRAGAVERDRVHAWLESQGLNVGSSESFVPGAVFELERGLLARFLRSLFSGDGGGVSMSPDGIHLELCAASERLARDVQHLLLRFGVPAACRSRDAVPGRRAYVLSVTGEDSVRLFSEFIGLVPGCIKQKELELALERLAGRPRTDSDPDTLPPEGWRTLHEACRAQGRSLRQVAGIESTQPHEQPRRSVPRGLVREVAARLGDERLGGIADSDLLWDTIVGKRPAGVEPVYDLTLPETASFVANDVVVHNSTYARCGIIVNVTPFEPEWEGIVTLEVSNTTPLPAKIYAGEGIAQVLFFESDEVCETSYADKKGKYQAQQGLTLPKL